MTLEAGYSRKEIGNKFEETVVAGLDYEKIRRDQIRESYFGKKFEEYLEEMFGVLKIKVTPQRLFKGEGEYCLVDFYEEGSGLWIEAKLSSHTASINSTFEKYQRYTTKLKIIHLRGTPRKWKDSSVEFVHVKEFYPMLEAKGNPELANKFRILAKGILPREINKLLSDFVHSEN